MPLSALIELKRRHLYDTIVLGLISKINALVDGKTQHLAQLVVAVRADGANAVRAERDVDRFFAVYLEKSLFAIHDK